MAGRWAPPSFAELVDWVEGRLDADEAARVSRELAQAGPAAREAVAWLREFVEASSATVFAEPPARIREALTSRFAEATGSAEPPGLLERVRAALVWDSRRQPGLALARSVASPVTECHLVYRAAGIDVALDIYPLGTSWVQVAGQVLPPADVISPVSSVRLMRHTHTLAMAPLDELGEFSFARVQPGSYEMRLLGASLEITVDVDLSLEPPR